MNVFYVLGCYVLCILHDVYEGLTTLFDVTVVYFSC